MSATANTAKPAATMPTPFEGQPVTRTWRRRVRGAERRRGVGQVRATMSERHRSCSAAGRRRRGADRSDGERRSAGRARGGPGLLHRARSKSASATSSWVEARNKTVRDGGGRTSRGGEEDVLVEGCRPLERRNAAPRSSEAAAGANEERAGEAEAAGREQQAVVDRVVEEPSMAPRVQRSASTA